MLTGCGQAGTEDMVSKEGFFFDTMISISLVQESVSKKEAEELLEESFALCGKYENIFSRTKKDSELYQVNHRTENEVQVSEELYTLLLKAREIYQLTDGRFDITVAPLSDLWDFKSDNPKVPDGEDVAVALESVGFSKVTLEPDNYVRFADSKTMLDVGALAKGYIADKLKEFLVSEGVDSGFINLGGNVLTIGTKVEGDPWKIGLQKPFAKRNESFTYVDAPDCSVVSSGIYERYFEQDGELYYHVLDPVTGYPVETDLSQVSIISQESLTGDALSTACLILGHEKGKELIENTEGVEAVFVLKNGEVDSTLD